MTMLDNWWAQRFFRLLAMKARSHSTSDSCYILHDPNYSTNLENILPFTSPSTINKCQEAINLERLVWKFKLLKRILFIFILTNVYRFKTDHTISKVKVQSNNQFNLPVVENYLFTRRENKVSWRKIKPSGIPRLEDC
jgi:hypothetical protein